MDKDFLTQCLKDRKTIRQIGELSGKSYTTVRYWMRKFKLRSKLKDRWERNKCKTCGKECKRVKGIFCSMSCHKQYEHLEYIDQWKSGKVVK